MYANDPTISQAFNKALDTIRSMGGIVIDPVYMPSADRLEHARGSYGGLVIAVDIKVNRHLSWAMYAVNLGFLPSDWA
jgi:hypothetical protein